MEPLLAQLENIIQSNENLALDSGDFTVEVQHVVVPEARGYEHQRKHLLNQMTTKLEEILKNTRSLMRVDLKLDPYCSVVAMMAGVDYYNSKTSCLKIVNFRRKYAFS